MLNATASGTLLFIRAVNLQAFRCSLDDMATASSATSRVSRISETIQSTTSRKQKLNIKAVEAIRSERAFVASNRLKSSMSRINISPSQPYCRCPPSNLRVSPTSTHQVYASDITFIMPDWTAKFSMRHRKKAYEYTPLPNLRSIRTLKLLKTSTKDELKVEFSAKSLDEAAQQGYYALSYTWGSAFQPSLYGNMVYGPRTYEEAHAEEIKFFVKIHGHSVSVSENLYDALQHFRQIPALENKSLWIDALCINQGDFNERTSQVSFMGSIYASAEKVIVWLGKEDYYSELALPLVEGLIESLYNNESTDENLIRKLARGFQQYSTFNDPALFQDMGYYRPFTNTEWIAIAEFYKRRWFFRLWVFQEVVLVEDPSDILVFCGLNHVNYEYLEFFALVMGKSGWSRSLSVLYENFHHHFGFEVFQRAWRVRPYVRDGPDSPRLHPLLSQWTPFITEGEKRAVFCAYVLDYTRDMEVTNPLDRLYAIRDILTWHTTSSRSDLLTLIPVPDYTIEAADMYKNLARNMMEHAHSLFFLSFVEDKWLTGLHVPSWVPDLSVPMSPYPIIGSIHKYNATLGWAWEIPQFQDEGRILVIDGLHVDNIEERSDNLFPYLLKPERCLHMLTFVARCFELAGEGLTSLFRTLLTDCVDSSALSTKPEHYPLAEVKASFRQWFLYHISRAIANKRENGEEFEIPSILLDDNFMALDGEPLDFSMYYARYLSLKDDDEHSAEFQNEIVNPIGMFDGMITRTLNRRLFRSTKHNALGLTAPSTRKGDQIWLLRGGDVPYVLRKNENGTYNFRGECLSLWNHGRRSIYERREPCRECCEGPDRIGRSYTFLTH